MHITNNKREFKFEATIDGSIDKATLEYRWLKGSMVLMHTLVPESMAGKGVGSALVQHVLEHARAHHLKIIVYCPFVAKYMKSHPEYNDLVDEGYRK